MHGRSCTRKRDGRLYLTSSRVRQRWSNTMTGSQWRSLSDQNGNHMRTVVDLPATMPITNIVFRSMRGSETNNLLVTISNQTTIAVVNNWGPGYWNDQFSVPYIATVISWFMASADTSENGEVALPSENFGWLIGVKSYVIRLGPCEHKYLDCGVQKRTILSSRKRHPLTSER